MEVAAMIVGGVGVVLGTISLILAIKADRRAGRAERRADEAHTLAKNHEGREVTRWQAEQFAKKAAKWTAQMRDKMIEAKAEAPVGDVPFVEVSEGDRRYAEWAVDNKALDWLSADKVTLRGLAKDV